MPTVEAHMIFEVMGRPPEHVKKALNELVVKMGTEKGIEIRGKTYYDPKPVKDSKELYLAFAEVEAEFISVDSFFAIIFGYLPSNVEIHYPEKLKVTNTELNNLSNLILGKIHSYDTLAKKIINEKNILIKQIQEWQNKGVIKVDQKLMKKEVQKLDRKAKASSKKKAKK